MLTQYIRYDPKNKQTRSKQTKTNLKQNILKQNISKTKHTRNKNKPKTKQTRNKTNPKQNKFEIKQTQTNRQNTTNNPRITSAKLKTDHCLGETQTLPTCL